ncbi:connector enhancer of kinase suppressor of ras 1 isoform X1 [Tachysurus ichikawai]
MEPITSWSTDRVTAWLTGLDTSLQQYAFEQWQLCGVDLLQLSSQQLEKLGVHKIGHQELILDAVEKLCTLTYGNAGENVRSLTEKLRAVAHSLQMGIQSQWRANTYDGHKATTVPNQELQLVLDLIIAAKALYSLLNSQIGHDHMFRMFCKRIRFVE